MKASLQKISEISSRLLQQEASWELKELSNSLHGIHKHLQQAENLSSLLPVQTHYFNSLEKYLASISFEQLEDPQELTMIKASFGAFNWLGALALNSTPDNLFNAGAERWKKVNIEYIQAESRQPIEKTVHDIHGFGSLVPVAYFESTRKNQHLSLPLFYLRLIKYFANKEKALQQLHFWYSKLGVNEAIGMLRFAGNYLSRSIFVYKFRNMFVEEVKIMKEAPAIDYGAKVSNPSAMHKQVPALILSAKKPEDCKKLIVYVHGGGFISQNPKTYGIVLRPLSLDLGVPILAPDYRLAPEYPFPAAIDDCVNAYHWAISKADQAGLSPDKVVLVGDSCGGNLAMSTVLACIQGKIRKPDGLVMINPCLDLRLKEFYPSMIHSLQDILVPANLWRGAYELYSSEPSNKFVSPSLAPENILKEFPKTRMMISSAAPLHDEAVALTERMGNAGCDVKTTSFTGLPHALPFFALFKKEPFARQLSEVLRTQLSELLE